MKIGPIDVEKGLLLAPMEDVTDPPFRRICKRLGADIVYTEFISSEGLVRDARRSNQKLTIYDDERPVSKARFTSCGVFTSPFRITGIDTTRFTCSMYSQEARPHVAPPRSSPSSRS